jgi:peptidyl-prolyl cis-trans isomerase C
MRLVSRITRILAAGFCGVALAAAQTPAATPPAPKKISPDDVVATVNGTKVTAGMIDALRTGAPPQFQAATKLNNTEFLKGVAGLLILSRLAEKEKVQEISPYKEQLEFMRLNFLANAYVANLNATVKVTPADIKKYYEEHKDDYEEAVARAIYISFSNTGGTDPQGRQRLTEVEAKAKAETLVAMLRKDADFAQLAKEQSDDAASAAKGGDIGALKRSSTGVPTEIREAVFKLKPGEISDPVVQPTGYYIFKLEKLQTTPLEEAAPTLDEAVRGAKINAELQKLLTDIKITHDNEAFFADAPAAGPPPPGAAAPVPLSR